VVLYAARPVYPEAMVQYFNTSWREMAYKMPELAEVGYESIWLPPPQKGSGGLSVGYDHWDPFDLGGKDQRGTVRTRYGTEAELLHLIEVAHRFGIRIYFDNIMNHRAFDIPGYNEGTPLDIYPGMRPEDFHLRVTEEGFYRKWDNTRDWNSAWQVMNLGLSDLIDIAHEDPNTNFGSNEGDDHPKISFIRQPDNPEYYPDYDLPIVVNNPSGPLTVYPFAHKEPYADVGYTNSALVYVSAAANNRKFDFEDLDSDGQHDSGEPSEPFEDTGVDPTRPGWTNATYGYGDAKYNMGNPVVEDVGGYLIRSVRWLMDYTDVDGLRLDAVKHVPDYFFGKLSGSDKDWSNWGYIGGAQEQFNLARGFSDWDNHRDSIFNTEQGRDDAMMFGEHLGEPPGYGGYIDAGMRLVDNVLRNNFNGFLGEPWGNLSGYDQPGGGGFSASHAVMHAQSHDNDFARTRELQHAFYFTRAGLPLIYTDGNYQAETLGQSGGAFPRHANTAFLGQFGDSRIPNLMYLHQHFARDAQIPKWGDSDVVAYERRDYRQSDGFASDTDRTVMFFAMNDNKADGQYREIGTTFNVGAYLWQYAAGGGGYYYTVENNGSGGGVIKSIIPPAGYFAFSWRTPEGSDAWGPAGGQTVEIRQNGQRVGTMSYTRRDGPDGDAGFNPYGVTDTNNTDYAYTWTVPRVTSGTNVSFLLVADGSAENILVRLDGGVDVNSQMGLGPLAGELRDNQPAISTDIFLGYEQPRYLRRIAEKFAATNTARNVIGSPGAETYRCTIGSPGFPTAFGSGLNFSDSTAQWVFHDPTANVTTNGGGTIYPDQFLPQPEVAAGSNLTLWVKIGYQFDVNEVWIYYTTNGTNPEAAGGVPLGDTRAVAMGWSHIENDGFANADWWKGTLPPQGNGTEIRYKIGASRNNAASKFPVNGSEVDKKKKMATMFTVTNLNLAAVAHRPHNDYSETVTGLADGFHILKARAYLKRDNQASLYNTFPQTFYLDLETPQGEITFPKENEELKSKEYGSVVRTDPTVTGVMFHIADSDPNNDDAATGLNNGNGLNTNGVAAWADASQVTPSLFIPSDHSDEWRFTYKNVATGGVAATISVRLLELSTSTDTNHYRLLTRNVTASAPNTDVFVAYPAFDGQTVDSNYVMKIYFSKPLADGRTPAEMTNSFLIRLNGVAQSKDNYILKYDISDGGHPLKPGDWHEIGFRFPNLFNGDPNFQHSVEVVHTTTGNIDLQASRLVKAAPADTGPFINIIEPPEVDSDGKPYEIILPDVASPDPEDRQYRIRVETDLDAQNVWLEFDDTNQTAEAVATIETRLGGVASVVQGSNLVAGLNRNLAGTVSATAGVTAVVGSGTSFSNELVLGQALTIGTNVSLVITQIASHTLLRLNVPFPGPTTNGAVARQQPLFQTELSNGDTVRISTNELTVQQILSHTQAVLSAGYPGVTASGLDLYRLDANPLVVGSSKFWDFAWSNITEGVFPFRAYLNTNSPDRLFTNNTATRTARILFREVVNASTNDADDDDDGLLDDNEVTALPPLTGNSEDWLNGEVHTFLIYGKTDPTLPDTDGDNLPDGLESGWRNPISGNTDTNTDTNGDGFRNFRPDLDPPFYNTVPDNNNLPNYNFNAGRFDLINGTMTDPTNPDTDYDGIPDGIEDWNRNGWLDGDGDPLSPSESNPNNRGDWPDQELQVGETWTETNPLDYDTDDDGAADGYGEDTDFNGWIAGDLNSNRVWNAGETWSESDPLKKDTDGDGLPDGWENQYQFDPLDNGTNSLRTGGAGSAVNGAEGNPDNDVVVIGVATNPYRNIDEFLNGTNPRVFNSGEPPAEGDLVIGRGDPIGVIAGVTNYQEFTDWSADDCIALDEYEGDGFNNQAGDTYLAYDGFDTSRDIVAFYARDDTVNDRVYFRVDFFDLQAFAEQANLDLYIVIDIGSPGDAGERVLPDDVDTLTDMKWEVVVAAYSGDNGAVYVNLGPPDSNTFGDPLGNVVNYAGGFVGSYYNSELDAVEIAIDRQALVAAGWAQVGVGTLNFQVFTTRDGTQNSPVGAGDIGGSDVRDTIYDDYVAEDYYDARQGSDSTLHNWIPGSFSCGRVEFASVVHGNQHIQPGSEIQKLINNGQGAGYHRLLYPHEVYRVPVNLHITPTLASALQWAETATNATPSWRLQKHANGPLFNDWIAELVSSNVVDLLASTFSDHILAYYTTAYNQDNAALARDFLGEIYGATFDTNSVFWNPERVFDADVFNKISAMGYRHSLIDQVIHLRGWFGREDALGENGYRLNTIDGVNSFVMNDNASQFRFQNDDGGLDGALRRLLSRKARSGQSRQVVTVFSTWEDFGNSGSADGYDRNIRWMANTPWIEIVSLSDLVKRSDINDWKVGRGTVGTNKIAQDFVHHASELNYDHWYNGTAQEEGLYFKQFEVRSGTLVPTNYGMMFFGGIVSTSWDRVEAVADTNLAKLARGTLHASAFQTAFHNNISNDLRKFSIGTYIYPDIGNYQELAGFSKNAQAQTRTAAIYAHVDTWAENAFNGFYDSSSVATNLDVDQDGEAEYLIFNDRVLGVFERMGGRMIGGWVRDILGPDVFQASGNLPGYAGSETEWEGNDNVTPQTNIVAYRTSLLKDWFAQTNGIGAGTVAYVNDLYTVASAGSGVGWTFTSGDGRVSKTVTLAPRAWQFEVRYHLGAGIQKLYVRGGLSPHLYDLLLHGQNTLSDINLSAGRVLLVNTTYQTSVSAFLDTGSPQHSNVLWNSGAQDDNPGAGVTFHTVNMRNQAQTHQVELESTSNIFAFAVGFKAEPSDWDNDGMPNTYEDEEGFDPSNPSDGSDDDDGDGVNNSDEYVGKTDPSLPSGGGDYHAASGMTTQAVDGVKLIFPTRTQREYDVYYSNQQITNPLWFLATSNSIPGTGGTVEWVDDGSSTAPHPSQQTNRVYRIDVSLPD